MSCPVTSVFIFKI